MDVSDLHPPDDKSHRLFIWHEWIQANGPLTHENVFDYFASSMFYDKQCNNSVLRMQTMHTGTVMSPETEAEELKRFTGIEFLIAHSEPPTFFIIQKRDRISLDEARLLETYFIMNNRIFQAPDVYTLFSNRLMTSLHSIQTSMDTLRSRRPVYTPRTGFVWPIVEPSTPSDSAKERAADGDAPRNEAVQELSGPHLKHKAASTRGRQQNNMLLYNAMRTTAVHANSSFTLPVAASESSIPETPGAGSGARSSATPAPVVQRAPTPKVPNVPTPQEAPPVKGPPGGGKKKKRRTTAQTAAGG
ncbi:MED6-domain-containing protein [Amylocystis lapponica]|nr:MED6-domain-containing protein [Amylocystis lapponica]